jgi:hypothetical protein
MSKSAWPKFLRLIEDGDDFRNGSRGCGVSRETHVLSMIRAAAQKDGPAARPGPSLSPSMRQIKEAVRNCLRDQLCFIFRMQFESAIFNMSLDRPVRQAHRSGDPLGGLSIRDKRHDVTFAFRKGDRGINEPHNHQNGDGHETFLHAASEAMRVAQYLGRIVNHDGRLGRWAPAHQ